MKLSLRAQIRRGEFDFVFPLYNPLNIEIEIRNNMIDTRKMTNER